MSDYIQINKSVYLHVVAAAYIVKICLASVYVVTISLYDGVTEVILCSYINVVDCIVGYHLALDYCPTYYWAVVIGIHERKDAN